MYEEIKAIAENLDFKADVAVVLGSGLGLFAERIDIVKSVNYSDIKGFPRSTVEGHKGRLIMGKIGGKNVAVMQGRVHYYEGYNIRDVVLPIRVMRRMGAETLILTNAAGGITMPRGALMMITDHINLSGANPLIGKNIAELGERFPDMTYVYDTRLQKLLVSAAQKHKINLKSGVYAQLSGPSYETPAEIKMLKIIGADAVGMSTATEAIAARHCGLSVTGISYISNPAAGIEKGALNHEEVMAESAKITEAFCGLLTTFIEKI